MPDAFLSFEQTPVELVHGPRLAKFLASHPHPLSGYTFAALVAWQRTFQYGWAPSGDDLLLLSYVLEPDPNRHLLQPIGRLTAETTERLVREAAALPYALRIIGVGDPFLEESPDFVKHFDVVEDRDMANYVYRASDLAELRGTHYSKKRNLLAQAANLYEWSTEPLTPERAGACFEVLDALDERDRAEPSGPMVARGRSGSGRALLQAPSSPTVLTQEQMLREEVAALEFTLRHFAELEQQGVLISVNGKPAAFSIFEPLTADTAVVHFERALRKWKGLYQIVNKAGAQALAARGFAFVNREEDVGDPGLRQAKESYHPAHLARSWTLTFKAR